jgi:hypothetical protein
MRVYCLIIGVLGIGLFVWASAHYAMGLPMSMAMGFVPGTLVASALTRRKR